MNKHQTFPGEPLEAPAEKPKTEIEQPSDPRQREIPEVDPERTPVEVPDEDSAIDIDSDDDSEVSNADPDIERAE